MLRKQISKKKTKTSSSGNPMIEGMSSNTILDKSGNSTFAKMAIKTQRTSPKKK